MATVCATSELSPHSTTIQVSPVHSGLCYDPEDALEDLFARLVA